MAIRSSDSIERCFSVEDGFALFGDPSDGGMSLETERLAARVIRLLDKLPPIEADWVHLFFFDRWSQDTIAALFNVSQPTVCYRLRRAEQRLRFLLSIPDGVDADRVCEDVRPVVPDEIDLAILHHMWDTTCQSETGNRLQVTQGLVRYRFHKMIRRLAQWVEGEGAPPFPACGREGVATYLRVMRQIADSPNLLKSGISTSEGFRVVAW